MLIYSWNLLHILHEIKHASANSKVLTYYNILSNRMNEKQRQTEIISKLKSFLSTSEPIIICLQEVPFDYYQELNQLEDITIYNYSYPRIPSCSGTSPYLNNSELLLIITKNIETGKSKITRFADPGKACLSIQIGETIYCNVHMPFKDEEFKSALELVLRDNKGEKLVICGDFNKTAFWITKILSQIKTDQSFKLVENNLTTHITMNKDGTENKKIYDHFLQSGFETINSFQVEPLESSDHFPINITL